MISISLICIQLFNVCLLFSCLFAVLLVAPFDEDAIWCKVVALIKEDRIDDVLLVIQASLRLPVDLSFFKVKIQALILLVGFIQTSFS